MRALLLVPVAVLGVLVMHGLADAGTPYVHAEAERTMDSHHSTPAPDHSSSHLAAMSICAFALVVAVHRLRRTAAPRRTLRPMPSACVARLSTGPEPPVPRPVV